MSLSPPPPAAAFLASLHSRLRRRRWATLTVVALLWALAVWLGSKATLDTSSLTFFPDSDPHMARMAEAMDMAPFSRLLLVDIALTPKEQAAPDGQAMEKGRAAPDTQVMETGQAADAGVSAQRLADVARAVAEELPPELAVRAGGSAATGALPKPQQLLRLLPSLVDEAALAQLTAAVQPQAVEQGVAQARATLAGLWGSMAAPWLQYDPLNFRRILLERLPQPPGAGMADPVLGFPLSADGRHVLLALRPARSLHDVDAAVTLMDALHAALQKHVPPDMRATVVGGHRHSAANTRTINSDIQRIALWSMAGFALVYALLVRSVSGAFWLLLTPLAAASATLGTLSLCWPVISGLALGFGASVLGIAEDYAVHMHFALRAFRGGQQGEGGQDGESAARAVLTLLSLPLFQGFLLNISGFTVLLFSSVPALRQLAAFALLTLTVGLVLALVVLPLCPGFDRPAMAAPHPTGGSHARKAHPRTGAVALSAALLLGLCVLLWPRIATDVSPRGMGADVEAMQRDAERLRSVWGGRAEHVWVVQGQSREETLEAARITAQHLRAQGQEVDTLTDLWPAPEIMAANIRHWQDFVAAHPALPALLREAGGKQGFAAAAFAPMADWLAETPRPVDTGLLREAGLGELADTFLDEGQHQRSPRGGPSQSSPRAELDQSGPHDGKSRVRTLLLGRSADAGAPKPQDALQSLAGLPAHVQEKVTMLSPAALEEALLGHLQREQRLLPAAALLCVLLLYACFRRVPHMLLAALPALAALAAILGWLGWSGTPLTLAGMATLPLVLGLALDHGVVVTHDLALGTHLGVDRAIVTSSLTALTGMGLLALAEHPALRSMGQIIFPGLVMEMLVALWVLPRLCAPTESGASRAA